MNRVDTKKVIASILRENQGSHEFEKVAKVIMKAICWTHLNRIRSGFAEIMLGLVEFRKDSEESKELLKLQGESLE
tara:strand:+ start:52 stop:279 length:228 start_codon:yes stop_codon:yes gene_type:complete